MNLFRAYKIKKYKNSFPYTPVSDKKKFVFIHIPKAAGTSVRVALGEPPTGRRHLPWWVYEAASGEKFKSYFKFTVVRNPISRTLSGYTYMLNGGNKTETDMVISSHIKKYKGFDDFVINGLVKNNLIQHHIFKPQVEYVCCWQGNLKVDKVLKLERLADDFREIAERLGIQQRIGVVNTSSKDIEANVSEGAKSELKILYQKDFATFNY